MPVANQLWQRTNADEKFSLRTRGPFPFVHGCLYPANRTISFLRDDVENRKVGWETGGRKGRTRAKKETSPFSSSLTIYPFGTTAHPPTLPHTILFYSPSLPPGSTIPSRSLPYIPLFLSSHFALLLVPPLPCSSHSQRGNL